ncbi:MAG: hypothetical protein HC831_13295 [Chloroflexia bacterium]|nr:hypothetical protein [Chloroflexia bacterium]
MAEQRELLDKTLNDWRGERPQLDDILVVGIQPTAKVSAKKIANTRTGNIKPY